MDFNDYYSQQAGNGYPVFAGIPFQKGNSFFGSFIKGSVLPLLKKVLPYFGERALNTGAEIAADIKAGKSFAESAKKRAADAAIEMGIDGLVALKGKRQQGSGALRRANAKFKRAAAAKSVKDHRPPRRTKRKAKRTRKRKLKTPKRKTPKRKKRRKSSIAISDPSLLF